MLCRFISEMHYSTCWCCPSPSSPSPSQLRLCAKNEGRTDCPSIIFSLKSHSRAIDSMSDNGTSSLWAPCALASNCKAHISPSLISCTLCSIGSGRLLATKRRLRWHRLLLPDIFALHPHGCDRLCWRRLLGGADRLPCYTISEE